MNRRTDIIITLLLLFTVVPATVSAQRAQTLRTERDVHDFCRYSQPAREVFDSETRDAAREEYEVARRQHARRPVVVNLDAKAAPVIEYDDVTGMLVISLYSPARLVDGYAVQVDVGAVRFEMTPERAHLLWARYAAGNARLEITFLPPAWADYDRPLCRQSDARVVIDGETLEAELVDEVGQSLARYETRLGHEVAMMRQHRIQGYLDSAMPVVAVSSIAPFPAGSTRITKSQARRLRSSIRSALYGCYLRGLSRNARLQGALVVQMSLGEQDSPRLLVDSLHSQDTSACVVERLEEYGESERTLPDELSLKATLIFRLEEAPGL
jgi:hypothetical protein